MCRRYVLAVEPALIERYVKPGKLRIVFRAVLNHGTPSDRAAEAAACAGRQGQFWPMYAKLFDRQAELTSAGGNIADVLQGFARELRLNEPMFRQCLTARQTLGAVKSADAEQRRRGIASQPVFEIGSRRIYGLQPLEALTQAIELELPD
jgi:protein-disulfide isomerase